MSANVQTAKAKDLAQTLIEGYYALMGDESSIVVALTNVAVTHFFKLKIPATQDGDE